MDLLELQKKLGYSFRDPELLRTALTHSSYRREHREVKSDNERLEFLGDGVLDAVIGKKLYELLKREPEGTLSKLRSLIVCERSLAAVGRERGINLAIRFGTGEMHTGGASKDSIICDAVEAVIGAVFIDSDYETCEGFVLDLLDGMIKKAINGDIFMDYKSEFQEIVQADGCREISYITDREEGPDHSKTFYVHIEVDGKNMGKGSGKTKKEAGQNAAKEAIGLLKR